MNPFLFMLGLIALSGALLLWYGASAAGIGGRKLSERARADRWGNILLALVGGALLLGTLALLALISAWSPGAIH